MSTITCIIVVCWYRCRHEPAPARRLARATWNPRGHRSIGVGSACDRNPWPRSEVGECALRRGCSQGRGVAATGCPNRDGCFLECVRVREHVRIETDHLQVGMRMDCIYVAGSTCTMTWERASYSRSQIVSHWIISYHIISYHIISHNIISWHTDMLYYIITVTIICYAILYYTMIYHNILNYNILYYNILYYTILYSTLLYYTMLYYNTLYYTIIYYTILRIRIHIRIRITILYYNIM